MTDELNTQAEQPKKNNTLLYIIIGAVVLCCICCGVALAAQWILQNSDFTLVNIVRPTL